MFCTMFSPDPVRLCFSKLVSPSNFFSFLNSACYTWQIKSLANSIRVLANMEDPIGRVLKRTQVRGGVIRITTSGF